MSSIPVYTTGSIGVPSTKVNVDKIENPIYVSAYTGNVLSSLPTFGTSIDMPCQKNKTFHGGLLINKNTIVCHKIYKEGPDQNLFSDFM
jgi:hypothetical protein